MIEIFLILAVVGLIIDRYFEQKKTKRINQKMWRRIEKLEEGVRTLLGISPV